MSSGRFPRDVFLQKSLEVNICHLCSYWRMTKSINIQTWKSYWHSCLADYFLRIPLYLSNSFPLDLSKYYVRQVLYFVYFCVKSKPAERNAGLSRAISAQYNVMWFKMHWYLDFSHSLNVKLSITFVYKLFIWYLNWFLNDFYW